jgi:hypothetical protein
MKQFPDRTSWQTHISRCVPEYVESLDNKDSIPCPHLICPAVLPSQSDLWHHLGDIHSTHKPDAGGKRQRQRGEGEDERVERSGAAKRKRPRLQGKSEDRDFKAPAGRKSAPKGRFEDPLGHTFVNVSAMDFDPSPADDGRESTILTPDLVTDGTESGISTPLSSLYNDTLDQIDPLLLASSPTADAPIQAPFHDVIDVDDTDERESHLAEIAWSAKYDGATQSTCQ